MTELPPGWVSASLGDIADLLDFEREPINSSERSHRIAGKEKADLYPYYGATGQVGWIDSYRSEGERVLLGEDGAPFLDPSKDKAYLANGRFWVNNHAHVIQGARGRIDNRFLCFQLNTVDYRPFVSGTTRLKLTSTAMKGIPLLVAPTNEQTRIVEKLEELLSDLEAGVAELKAAQKKLVQYRQSLLKAAVEGSLTADWRAEHSNRNEANETGSQLVERILAERRARWEANQLAKFKEQGTTPPNEWQVKYLAPTPLETTDLPELPEGWTWTKVGLTGDVQLGRQRAPKYHRGPNMVPYLRVANVFEDHIDVTDVKEMDFSKEEEDTYRLQFNDILLNEGQSLELVGRPAIYRDELPKACFTNTLVRYRAEQGILPDFALTVFLHYLHSGRFRKIATITTNIAHLGLGRLADVEFPLPCRMEQVEIVKMLAKQLALVRDQQLAVEVGLTKAASQRKNILKSAFSGQLVQQNLSDEPASELLTQIRAERVEREKQPKPRRTKARKEVAAMASKMIEVLTNAGDWVPAQEAFRLCGVVDGSQTEQIEVLYAELRELDRANQLAVEPVTDEQGRKLSDRLKFISKA